MNKTKESIFGYVRVSAKDQNEIRQLVCMREIGIPEKNIYIDKQSGKDFNRPMYKLLIESISENDVVYVKSIDRLGRNYEEIIEQWKFITKEKRADIVIIDMPLLDTRRGKDLMDTFLSDIVLALLSYISETERENIKRRQAEGIEAALARGVHFGRKEKPLPECWGDVYNRYRSGEISVSEAARICEMPKTTFYDKAKRYEEMICHGLDSQIDGALD